MSGNSKEERIEMPLVKSWKENLEKKNQGTTCFERRMKFAQLILKKLKQQPLRWTPLLKSMIQVCGSPPRLYYMLKFLEQNGFVQRVPIKGKSHCSITDRGKELLRVLSENKDSSKTCTSVESPQGRM